MELQEIDVFIEPNGEVRLEVRGVHGGGCLDLTKALEDALGGAIQHRELTSEFHASDAGQSIDQRNQTGA
ncbi:MAG: DUF2997 domain-containing protein [Verrucomicrobiota bacterium]